MIAMTATNRLSVRTYIVKLSLPFFVLAGLTTWLLLTPPGLFGKLDAVGYSVCHQIPGHSFILFGRHMPLCSRCTGMYLGALVGLVFLLADKRRALLPAKKLYIPIGISLLLFVVDGVNSFLAFDPIGFRFYTPQNGLRLFTGATLGLAIPLFLVPVFNLAAWKDTLAEPSVRTFRKYFLMLAAALLLASAVLVDAAWLRFVFAILSVLTVVAILVIVYAALWMILIRREANLISARQLWPWLTAGLGSALIQIALMDLLRYGLTGTWQGFLT